MPPGLVEAFYRLASFKTCCKTDIAVGSVGEHSVLKCQAQRGCATQRRICARRSLLDNQCKVVLRELVGPADLMRVQFVVPANFARSHLGSASN